MEDRRLITDIDGKRRNLRHFSTGPYRYDDAQRVVIDGFGHVCYQLELGEKRGIELAERWSEYYALYVMLK
jgi:hypothetical protein